VIHTVYEPSIRARLGTAAHLCGVVVDGWSNLSSANRGPFRVRARGERMAGDFIEKNITLKHFDAKQLTTQKRAMLINLRRAVCHDIY